MTRNTYAVVEDTLHNERRIKTEPFTNYNIAVIDQSFGQYSYLNVINLNKYVPESQTYSNVTGSAFKFTDKKNRYGVYGTGAVSLINSFTGNAMGYFTLQNELNHNLILKYSMFQPKGKFLTFNTSLQSTYKSLYEPILSPKPNSCYPQMAS